MFNKAVIQKAALALGLAMANTANADAPPSASVDQVEALQAQLQAMERQMSQMRAQLATLSSAQQAHEAAERAESVPASVDQVAELESQVATLDQAIADIDKSSSWTDKISMKGDFRYRYEDIREDGRADRDRQRLRARLSLTGQVNDRTKIELRLASGSDNALSGNQTFDNLATTKDFRLDRAYVQYAVTDQLDVLGGKMKRNFYRPGENQMLWDDDLTPEGFAINYSNGGLFAHAANWLLEESSSSDDSYLHGLQGGYRFGLGQGELTFGAGYYLYDFAAALGFSEVENLQVFADYNTTLWDRPLTLFVDHVTNQEADDFDTGYRLGFEYGKVKAPGSIRLGLAYTEVEENSVFGGFSDSNFIGGGTNGDGWIARFGYGVADNTEFRLSLFINEFDINADAGDYDRLQADLRYKF